jgi:hypothetical protein
MSDRPDARKRTEAEADQDRAGDRDRRAEAGGALEERAEAKGDQEQLQATVIGDAADAVLEHLEQAEFLRELVEEDDVEDDPTDRQKPEGGAEERRFAGHFGRHAEYEDGARERNGEAEQRRHVGFHAEYAEPAEEDDDRQRRDERRQPWIAQRIVNLRPDHRCLP